LVKNGVFLDEYLRLFPDLDHALEWCENKLIERDQVTRMHMPVNLRLQLADSGFSREHTKRMEAYLEQLKLEPDDILVNEGDDSDALYFIETGQVTVYVHAKNNNRVRLQTLSPGTLVGEVGFFLDSPRSASVIADRRTVAYRLSRSAMLTMQENDPELALAFKDLIIRLVSERLSAADREIVALNR
jgi:sulfate permease, SulP family